MSMISTRTRRVKPTRRTARPDRPFASGLTYFVPAPVLAPGFFEPSPEDRAWAAIHLNADDLGMAEIPEMTDEEADYLAGEAAALASMEALTPRPVGICKACGELVDSLSWGLCDDCFERAAEEATTAGENERAGLGYRVF